MKASRSRRSISSSETVSVESVAPPVGTVARRFETCELIQRDGVSVATSPDLAAVAYCQGTPLRNEILAREPDGLQRATSVAGEALELMVAGATVADPARVDIRGTVTVGQDVFEAEKQEGGVGD